MVCRNHNLLNGSSIAINEIANCLGDKNEVFIFDVSKSHFHEREKKYIEIKKKISMKALFVIITTSITTLRLTFQYLNRNPQGILTYFSSLFNNGIIKEFIEGIKPDIIHFHGVVIEYLPLFVLADKMKIPYIVTLHGLNSLNPELELYFKKKFEKEILIDLSKNHKIITSVSKSTKELMISEFGIPSDYIKVVHNGVNADFNCQKQSKKELRYKNMISDTKIVLIQVGTLVKIKNHLAILTAQGWSKNLQPQNDDLKYNVTIQNLPVNQLPANITDSTILINTDPATITGNGSSTEPVFEEEIFTVDGNGKVTMVFVTPATLCNILT